MRLINLMLLCAVIFQIFPYFAYPQAAGFNMSLTIFSPTCFDGTQNQNETGVDCGGPCAACSGGGTGGGSGGGRGKRGSIYIPPKEKNGTCFTKSYLSLKNNTIISNEIDITDFALYFAEIKLAEPAKNISLIICHVDVDTLPVKKNLSPYDYQFFNISYLNLDKEKIAYEKLYFRVPISWIEGWNASFEKFNLLNFNSHVWLEYETEFLSNDTEYYYF